MATCLQCAKEFDAVRSTAKYCSDKCKLQYNRGLSNTGMAVLEATEEVPETTAVVEVVKITEKRECKRSDLCCTDCVDFESGVHWCPNKGCGCFETREEQLASLNAFQEKCPHPDEELFASRCLLCGHISFVSHSGQGSRKI